MPVKWFGPKVKQNAYDAIRQGMDDTLSDSVAKAVPLAPIKTGRLRRSLKIQPSQQEGKQVVGFFGSFNVEYAGRMEERFRYLYLASQSEFPKVKDNIKARLK